MNADIDEIDNVSLSFERDFDKITRRRKSLGVYQGGPFFLQFYNPTKGILDKLFISPLGNKGTIENRESTRCVSA